MDAEGFLVQFSDGSAPEHLLAPVDRVDAAAAWAEENRPAWFGAEPPPLHAFSCNGELPTSIRNGLPGSPLLLSDAPAAIADVATLVELHRPVGGAWTVHLDEGWVRAARREPPG
ncbi:hypothetical protein [Streptomyces sp. NPDC058872]|uniref:hypothetical protein n=1 Tax=Streptomyces sp. NPDC058872 TaxID=3346661 RepID=UPI0036899B21